MSNHTTPGNWQASLHRAPIEGRHEREVVTRDNHVATCYGDTAEEAEANAKTCAAAPDMRALLQDLDKWGDYMGGFEAPVWERLRSLLATLPQ